MISVVDYGRGNLFSIGQAMRRLGAGYEITDDPERIRNAERIVLPGVGAFGDAMHMLGQRNLVGPIREAAVRGTPLLGICVGMQLLASHSDEFGSHEGLGLIPGKVRCLPEGGDIRVPNVGWRTLKPVGDFALPDGTMMYFVHSYAPFPDDTANVVATTEINGEDIPAIIRKGRVVGCQFHPEKSGSAGLTLFGRLLAL